MKFKAFVVNGKDGIFSGRVEEKDLSFLPKSDLLINVKYSSLNYKDALSSTGNKGITKQFPHIPGIDAAGIVVESNSKEFLEGDKVIASGFEFGANWFGGFSEYIRVPSEWVIKLPRNLSLKESIIYGVAGFTAGLSLSKIEKITSNDREDEFLVTGATGGVGSLSIAILKQAGYKNITAATGKLGQLDFLKEIGATKIIDRKLLKVDHKKPLLHKIWGNAIDVVGGDVLDYLIRTTKEGGAVAACGLVKSSQLNLSVFPFILRGVALLGIDSAHCKKDLRKEIWNLLANEWKIKSFDSIHEEISLEELDEKINQILEGKIVGRVLINLNK